ncbi:hypothetical protein THAOC_20083, partial [Thalassiosira oceanica]
MLLKQTVTKIVPRLYNLLVDLEKEIDKKIKLLPPQPGVDPSSVSALVTDARAAAAAAENSAEVARGHAEATASSSLADEASAAKTAAAAAEESA